ncbi:hypothetical protein ACLKA7_016481 [Drosophila subpalustris]
MADGLLSWSTVQLVNCSTGSLDALGARFETFEWGSGKCSTQTSSKTSRDHDDDDDKCWSHVSIGPFGGLLTPVPGWDLQVVVVQLYFLFCRAPRTQGRKKKKKLREKLQLISQFQRHRGNLLSSSSNNPRKRQPFDMDFDTAASTDSASISGQEAAAANGVQSELELELESMWGLMMA